MKMSAPLGAPVLELRNVTKIFGGLVAVNNVSFTIATGSITGLIGPNGAGKTTVFNLITGLDEPSSGAILYAGRESPGQGPTALAAQHLISRTFQNIRLFGQMSVVDNVRVGRYLKTRAGLLASTFKPGWVRKEERESAVRARELLDFVGLSHRSLEPARNLSYGEQRRVEVARALAMEPKCILLDEPAAGFTDRETEELGLLIQRIRQANVTVLLIEHKMGLVMNVCDRIIVLNFGAVIAQGSSDEIQANPAVIEAYLGRGDNA